jgi:NADPH-dependent glutamate synthase beta subunit-like oxidoreductase
VKVVVRSGFEEMKASPWEKEDAQHEGIPILNYHVPKAFICTRAASCTGMRFEIVKAVYDDKGRRSLVPTGEPDVEIECDEVLVAVGQENAFPWIERDCGIEFDQWGLPKLDEGHAPVQPPRCSSAATRPSAPRTSSRPWPTATRRRCRSTAAARRRPASGPRPPST